MTANPPSSRVNHRDLYAWAPDELLDECSSLVSTRARRDHVGDPNTYNHRAFAKRHDDDIAVLPCTLSNVPGRVLLTPFQHSFTGWKGKFFKVCCSDLVPSALDGFPLYWVKEVRALKSKSLKGLPSNDREACQILASAGGFDAAALISLEYNAEALEKYISMRDSPCNLLFLAFVGFSHDLSCLFA